MKPLPLAFRQIHLDFHTSEQIPGVGSRFDPDEFVRVLQQARINSITCFSKCHHGMIYHDTRFPARHPHLELNLLDEQIRACHAAGIRVPIYISVGWDEYMASRHPEWIEIDHEGRRAGAPLDAGWKKLCLNSAYVDYLSEQTAEVMDLFPVDGLFFDIIHQRGCCCPRCLQGMQEAGLDPAQPAHRAAFSRSVLDALRARIQCEVRRRSADCLIFWNSGHVDPSIRPVLETFSHLELESLPTGGWGYEHFPLTVRYARGLGLPYLGMTARFQKTWSGFGEYKSRAALEYDCFTALAEGARCSIGDQLHPRGELSKAAYDLIGQVYRQVEEREPWCVDSEPVTEIAILSPEAIGAADGRADSSAAGALRMLAELHYQFDLVDCESDWSQYRVLILPDKIRLTPALTSSLRAYLAAGGAVLASHLSGLDAGEQRIALTELGVTLRGESPFSPEYVVGSPAMADELPEGEHVIYARGLRVDPEPGVARLAESWQPYFNREWNHFCGHRHTPVDRPTGFPAVVQNGRAVYIAYPIFSEYLQHGLQVCRALFHGGLRRLLPDEHRLVQTTAPSTARITLMRQPASDDRCDRLVAHLLHYVPEARYKQVHTVEESLPLCDVRLTLRTLCPTGRVYLAPSGEDLPFTCGGSSVEITLPRMTGHAMVVCEGVDRSASG